MEETKSRELCQAKAGTLDGGLDLIITQFRFPSKMKTCAMERHPIDLEKTASIKAYSTIAHRRRLGYGHIKFSFISERLPPCYPWRTLLVTFLAVVGFWSLSRNLAFGYVFIHTGNNSASSSSIPRNPAYIIRARHGAVASENKRCSIIGVDVLKDGGNAVDSAISATLCIGVVNMFS